MMRKLTFGLTAVAALAALGLLNQSLRAAPAAATTITVEGMHCPICAKKIVAKLAQVAGVAAVRPNVPASTLTVQPRAGQAPSPRGLWEAVERAGYKPTRLESPGGTFTARPQS